MRTSRSFAAWDQPDMRTPLFDLAERILWRDSGRFWAMFAAPEARGRAPRDGAVVDLVCRCSADLQTAAQRGLRAKRKLRLFRQRQFRTKPSETQMGAMAVRSVQGLEEARRTPMRSVDPHSGEVKKSARRSTCIFRRQMPERFCFSGTFRHLGLRGEGARRRGK